ncbi:hypothetical protein O3M35_010411 [Rhynocoris fuscipes]|uniref:pyridoxal 5'-phosphate synthase n=1 Tax=Rhynocoris fuscipes TaxID=488301 RepID=A0AAW1CYS3_9HEMI
MPNTKLLFSVKVKVFKCLIGIADLNSFHSLSFRCYSGNMTSFQNLQGVRTKYKEPHEAFTEDQLVSKDDPFKQFHSWFEIVKGTKEIIEPNAVCIATADKNAVPSARMVLLKGYGPDGFEFFTHYTSRKGKEMDENPKAALLFYWDILHRQVRIEGNVKKLPIENADQYFKSRPVPSQIGSAASDQSKVVPNRDYLINKSKELEKIYEETGDVKRPPQWGGYLIVPEYFEFWQGQSDRVHDRICYKKNETGWECFRLAP